MNVSVSYMKCIEYLACQIYFIFRLATTSASKHNCSYITVAPCSDVMLVLESNGGETSTMSQPTNSMPRYVRVQNAREINMAKHRTCFTQCVFTDFLVRDNVRETIEVS